MFLTKVVLGSTLHFLVYLLVVYVIAIPWQQSRNRKSSILLMFFFATMRLFVDLYCSCLSYDQVFILYRLVTKLLRKKRK